MDMKDYLPNPFIMFRIMIWITFLLAVSDFIMTRYATSIGIVESNTIHRAFSYGQLIMVGIWVILSRKVWDFMKKHKFHWGLLILLIIVAILMTFYSLIVFWNIAGGNPFV